ncbi:hypothetical protein QWY99_11185 [Flavobacterium branchiarum]|uniref:3-keto-disaccharide hydrolase domain-containing protein n=1 Tax=Flavobacterium branchiarum TaxID=1114870 RepID=A0ABV5FGL3_9FLAO|nr:hypothetical protein [Flavobacterium branchiarum]MDN3673618.1 hypothetical protein [Flavobacterium branchiarum]
MKFKYTLLLLLPLLISSCATTISTPKKEYQLAKHKLKSHWKPDSEKWLMQNDTLIGNGGPMIWATIVSKKQLPKNYEITFKANMTKESLFEIMLNLDHEKYIRTYLYQINQNIIIGRGKYVENSNKYGDRGGPTLFSKPMKLENNHWYSIKIRVLNNQLSFSVDDDTTLECSIEKSNLSQHGKLGFITNGEVKITDLIIKSI